MSQYTPAGWNSITPRIAVAEPKKLVAFVTEVFLATGDYTDDRPTELVIGDSRIMIGDVVVRAPFPAFLYVYVPDVEATFKRAIDAGATAIEAPTVMPYGDHRGMFEDDWGNLWQVATRLS